MISYFKRIIKQNGILFKTAWFIKNKPLNNTIAEKIAGNRNKINYPQLKKLENFVVDIRGNDNVIKIGSLVNLKSVTIYIRGDFNTIVIDDEVLFNRNGELWIEDNGCLISIGKKTSFESAHIAATEDNSKITIGEDCMFANDIDIRSGDSHSILNADTGERINYARDVVIGNHVWVAAHCSILKGVKLADNSVVATRSVVTKPFTTEGVLIGGSPAKVLKENILWDRKRL